MKTRREIEVALERAGAAMAHALFRPVELTDDVAEQKRLSDLARTWDQAHNEWQQIGHLTGTVAQPVAEGYEELARPTDLSKRLREHDDARLYHEADVLMSCAADEIERYYGGMVAWKQAAEAKDASLAQLAERVAVLEAAYDYLRCAGSGLSNIAYNLAQPSSTIDANVRASMDRCRKAWDNVISENREALAATPQPHADEATKGVVLGYVSKFVSDNLHAGHNVYDATFHAKPDKHRTVALYAAPPSPAEDKTV
jgi:hypothetical protein